MTTTNIERYNPNPTLRRTQLIGLALGVGWFTLFVVTLFVQSRLPDSFAGLLLNLFFLWEILIGPSLDRRALNRFASFSKHPEVREIEIADVIARDGVAYRRVR